MKPESESHLPRIAQSTQSPGLLNRWPYAPPMENAMTRHTSNFLLDLVLALDGLAVLTTGLLIGYILPAGSRGATIWGWTRHDWGELHLYLALGLVTLVLVHLLLHWSWVCVVGANVLARIRVRATARLKAAVGAVAILLVVGAIAGFLYAAAVSKHHDGEVGNGGGHGWGRWSQADR